MNDPAATTKTFECSECSESFDYQPTFWKGREFGPPSICALCAEEEEKRRKQEEADDKFHQRLRHAHLPKGLHGIDYTGFTHQAAVKAAQQWARGEVPGLCLTGPVGVGKTYLAAAATWDRLHNRQTRWVSVARLLTQLRSGFGEDGRSEASAVISGTGAVVLDDLDKVNPTDYGREVIFAALDGRVEEGAQVLVTTNKSMSEIGEQLGEAVMSRLAGYCTVVRMGGTDRRVS